MMIQTKSKSSVAFTCLLDLLFVLIFAALLKVDPTSVEKIAVTGSVTVNEVIEELKNSVKALTERIKQLQRKNEELQGKVDSSDSKMKQALNSARVELRNNDIEMSQLKKQNMQLRAKVKSEASARAVTNIGGLWEGTGCQTNVRSCWSIKVAMPFVKNYPYTNAVPLIKMSYPSLGCKAKWYFKENVNGALKFEERITSGGCINKGTVIITAKIDGSLDFEYEKGRHRAFGTLARSGS